MEENDKENLYTAEDILEFLCNMCNRCKNEGNEKREQKIKNYKEQLLMVKNHKIDKISKDIGIKF